MSALFPNKIITPAGKAASARKREARKAYLAMSPHERRAFLAYCGYMAAARGIVAESRKK